MITLYAFEPAFGLPSGSPFVVKAMILLKMADQPFGMEILADPNEAPKGKLPYIRDDGEAIADSELIRQHLEQRYQADFFSDLTPVERAHGLGLQRLAEEHLYWCGMYHHWQIDAHWPKIKALIFGMMPADQQDAVADEVRAQVLKDLYSQGMGRHSYQEMLSFAEANLEALSDALSNQPFFFGDKPTGIDAGIAPQLLMISEDPFKAPLNDLITGKPALVAYAKRTLEHFFPNLK